MKNHLLLSMSLLCFTVGFSQTLVNLQSVDTLGHPTILLDLFVVDKDHDATNGIVVAVMNRYVTGQEENYYIFALRSGVDTLIWDADFNSISDARDFGTDVFIKGDYVYVTGFSWDSAANSAEWNTMKIDIHNGHVMWTVPHQSSYSGLDGPTAVMADDDGNVFVCGTKQSGVMDSRLAVIKYDTDGVELWYNTFDSTGRFDGGVGMVLENKLFVTGFSGTAFGSWDFINVAFDADDGSFQYVEYSPNGNGNFSSPAGITKDNFDHFYVAGTAASGAAGTDFKLIKYDSLFTEVWVRTWGDSLLPDVCTAMQQDNQGNLILTGNSTNALGATNITVLKYDPNGNLLWNRSISAASNHNAAKGRDLAVDDDDNIYLTGHTHNGSDNDLLTASYDASGNMRWLKTYSRSHNTDEKGLAIVAMGNTVFVSGASYGTDSVYVLLRYEQKEFTTILQIDTDSIPLYAVKQLIIRFDTSGLIKSAINNGDIRFGTPDVFLKEYVIDSIFSKISNLDFKKCILVKIAPNYHTYDTVLISNLGDTIPIPPFWSSFLVYLPNSSPSEVSLIDTLNNLRNYIRYAHLNYAMVPFSCACGLPCPDDEHYDGQVFQQYSLHDDGNQTYENGHVNVEGAWAYTTGKIFVKVGVFDSGIEWNHEDFLKRTATLQSKVIGGYGYAVGNAPLYSIQPPDWNGHGTQVAGIIGALRNNDKGIAGVAGGNWCNYPWNNDPSDAQAGCHLYSFGISRPGPNSVAIINASDAISAMADALSNNPTIDYSNMLVTNHSYGVSTSDVSFPDFKEKFYYAFRLGKISVASRGNLDRSNQITYPACFEDDWILNTGGSGSDGDRVSGSMFGENVDVVAPYSAAMNATTGIYNSYRYINGTSISAAYVTGLSALLLSYMNNPNGLPSYENLAPEDVEEIIQRTAWLHPNYTPPYDDNVGWGRINMGAALEMVDKNYSRLLHFDSDHLTTTASTTKLTTSDIDIVLTDDVPNTNIPKGTYKTEVWKCEETVNHNIALLPGESIQGFWARSSSSDAYPYYITAGGMNYLSPFEKAYVDDVNLPDESDATIWGYYYKLKDPITLSDIGWVPENPLLQQPKMSYTLYLTSGVPTTVSELKKGAFNAKIFPNPANKSFTLNLEMDGEDKVSIDLQDSKGSIVAQLYNGTSTAFTCSYDVSHLHSGICYLRINSIETTDYVKLVIQK